MAKDESNTASDIICSIFGRNFAAVNRNKTQPAIDSLLYSGDYQLITIGWSSYYCSGKALIGSCDNVCDSLHC